MKVMGQKFVGGILLGTLALLVLMLGIACGEGDRELKLPDPTASHGILHCELNPNVCSHVCGTASPTCELSGQCMCRHGPEANGYACKEPNEVEALRCHPRLCLQNKITRPLVCQLAKSVKVCACFPTKK